MMTKSVSLPQHQEVIYQFHWQGYEDRWSATDRQLDWETGVLKALTAAGSYILDQREHFWTDLPGVPCEVRALIQGSAQKAEDVCRQKKREFGILVVRHLEIEEAEALCRTYPSRKSLTDSRSEHPQMVAEGMTLPREEIGSRR